MVITIDSIDAPILKALCEKAGKNEMRMHMPGHGGRNSDGIPDSLFKFDYTELCDTDNLLDPKPDGMISRSEHMCADMYGALDSLYSCGGATLCIQTAVAAALRFCGRRNPRVLCDRVSHKSVINVLSLLEIDPEWFFIDELTEEKVLGADILVYTSASYYGELADSAAICSLCQRHGVISIADNSHASHIAFTRQKKLHPLNNGADFVVDSFHKTLPVMTGGAALHIGLAMTRFGTQKEIREYLLSYMRLFSSTSPSFTILASIDSALAGIRAGIDPDEGGICRSFTDSARALDDLRKSICELFNFKRYQGTEYDALRLSLFGNYDFGKLYSALYSEGICAEMFSPDALVMIPFFGFSYSDAERISAVLRRLAPKFRAEPVGVNGADANATGIYRRHIPLKGAPAYEMLFAPKRCVGLSKAVGEICADVYAVYPPGIPAIVPGEIFDAETAEALNGAVKQVFVYNVY
ncbi:MAG: hypothetical protein VB118_10855 [Oscillospiraceae bacterium]|nr:hypothetical protein [Oscillospiraceae bacterium]